MSISDFNKLKAPAKKKEPEIERAPEPKLEKVDALKEAIKARPKTKKAETKQEVIPEKSTKKSDVKIPVKKKKKKKAKNEKQDDLSAILKSVQNDAARQKTTSEQAVEDSKTAGADLELSSTERDAIKSQIVPCWNIPAGAKNAEELSLNLRLTMSRDGEVLRVVMDAGEKARYNKDTFFRAAVDSAIRAVRKCSPLEGLPAEKFASWQELELNFDPGALLR